MKQKVNVDEWIGDGKHLPEFMRDFHDQKDLFKAIDAIMPNNNPKYMERPSWIAAHCYVIDVFLWFMARRGYTLQRTRKNGDFRDVQADVEAARAQRDAAVVAIMPKGT